MHLAARRKAGSLDVAFSLKRVHQVISVVNWWLVGDTGLLWFVFESYYIDVGVPHEVKCIVEVRNLLRFIGDEFRVEIIGVYLIISGSRVRSLILDSHRSYISRS